MNPIFMFKNAFTQKWCLLALAALFITNLTFAQGETCSSATALSCGSIVTGNNEGASTEDLPDCNLNFPGQTVWYSVQGTGGEITVSTCNSVTNFDSQIGIFEGSCGALSCVAGNNNSAECSSNLRLSNVTFDSEAGTTYYIVVAGVSGADGDYQLSVSCAIVAPENDICDNAASIACGDVVSGSTAAATSQSLPFCGTSLSSAPGVWYVLEGTGGEITVTTCNAGTNFDTKLGVFDGSCDALSCVGGDDDDSCPFSSLRSRVIFNSEAGEDYYIYVTGFGSNRGDYELSVECSTVNPVDNDVCADAIGVTCGETITGSTEGAGSESVSFCGTSLTTAGGVWYAVEGTGSDITVTTCNPGTEYDTKLGVFTGSCGDLVCVGGNDDQAGGTDPDCVVPQTGSSFNRASTVTFTSQEGDTYYILVTGFSTNTGTFELTIECEEIPDDNGDCANAIDISCDDVVTGNTELNGAVNSFGTSCGSSQSENISTAPGLWYVFQGNDRLVTLSTCSDATDYDTKIAVFSGSCGDLVCQAINDNNNDCSSGRRTSLVEFAAFAGETYYVYVTGHQGSKGNFEMTVDCSLLNDTCENALRAECGDVVSGSTAEATNQSLPFCGTSLSSAPGVWYVVEGTGLDITVTTCNAGTNYDTKLGVFEGSCGSLVCVGGDDDDSCPFSSLRSRVTFTSNEGTDYYIYVTGFGSSTGNYEVSIDCEEDNGGGGDDNDLCGGATEIFCGDSVTGATDDGATSDDAPSFCGTSLTSAPGRWYSFTGLGDNVTLTTCNPGTNYDTKIGVFTGSCGALVCVGGNDDQVGGTDPDCVIPETGSTFNRASTVTFAAMNGTTYYIYVTGFSTNSGTFELTVDCGGSLTDQPAGLVDGTNTTHLNSRNLLDAEKAQIGDFYPNPAEFGLTNIEIYAPQAGLARIQLFDNMGRLAVNREVEVYGGVNTVSLQLGDLPSGSYFANIQIGEFTGQKKLMIVQ